MSKHLKNRFTKEEVIEILERYFAGEIGIPEAISLLKIKRRRFFQLSQHYRHNPEAFSINRKRTDFPNKIDTRVEKKIIAELKKEKILIEDKRNPIRFYNYSYIREQLEVEHGIKVSLPTIIDRAKKMAFTNQRP